MLDGDQNKQKPSLEVEDSKALKLTFPGVENLQYPNGARFQYGDIVAPTVVQEIFEVYNLADYNLTGSEFKTSLLAEPYTPEYPFIVAHYNKLFANKKTVARNHC